MNTATFVKSDGITQGHWPGAYGGDGYFINNLPSNNPAYATVALTGIQAWTWTASTTDKRALANPAGPAGTGMASAWYSPNAFSIDINLTDGNSHPVALYMVDWDGTRRTQTIIIKDAATAAILDTRSVSSFNGGMWLVWNVTGHVTITITRDTGDNAVISGIFFGLGGALPTPTPSPTPTPAPTATLTATPATLTIGGSAVLTWTTTNATAVTLTGASITSNGTQLVAPSTTTTYTLLASGSGGNATATTTLTVTPATVNNTTRA